MWPGFGKGVWLITAIAALSESSLCSCWVLMVFSPQKVETTDFAVVVEVVADGSAEGAPRPQLANSNAAIDTARTPAKVFAM